MITVLLIIFTNDEDSRKKTMENIMCLCVLKFGV